MNTEERVAFFLLTAFYPVLLWLIFARSKKYLMYRLINSFAFLKGKESTQGWDFFATWSLQELSNPQVFLTKLLWQRMLTMTAVLQIYGFFLFVFVKYVLGIDSIAQERTAYFIIELQLALVFIAHRYHYLRLVEYEFEVDEAQKFEQETDKIILAVKQRLSDLAEDDDSDDDYLWRESKN